MPFAHVSFARPLAALALLVAAGSASAAVINVPADQPTIQTAINTAGAGDVVVVAPGVYPERVDFLGKRITVRSAQGPSVTTITGAGFTGPVLLAVNGETTATVLEGFTITGGDGDDGGGLFAQDAGLTIRDCVFIGNSASSEGGGASFRRIEPASPSTVVIENTRFENNSAVEYGGGLQVNSMTLTLRNVEFVGNTCDFRGGGLVLSGGSNSLIEDVLFENNSATDDGGGGDIAANLITLRRLTVTNNTAGDGGGLYLAANGATVLSDSTFTNNVSASRGGGLDAAGDVSIFGVAFVDNHADGRGGGVHLSNLTNQEIADVTFENNSAGGDGGGGYFASFTNTVVRDASFVGNNADNRAGGVYLSSFGGGSTLLRVAVSDNAALGNGGGVYASSFSDSAVEYSRITNNTSGGRGGGFYLAGADSTFANSLIAENAANQQGGGFYVTTNTTNFYMNLTVVGNTASAAAGMAAGSTNNTFVNNSIFWNDPTVSEFSTGSSSGFFVNYSLVRGGYTGIANPDADPLFIDPASGDYRLGDGSPAIDQGNSQSPVAQAYSVDLVGEPRFVDDPSTTDGGKGSAPIVDLGAFEYQGPIDQPCPGDATGDGLVNADDLLIVLAGFGQPTTGGSASGDFNDDGLVNADDLLVVLAAFGQACP